MLQNDINNESTTPYSSYPRVPYRSSQPGQQVPPGERLYEPEGQSQPGTMQSQPAYAPQQATAPNLPVSGNGQPQPQWPPRNHDQLQPGAPRKRRMGTGGIIVLTLLLATIFGGLLFAAGWEFGHGSSTAVITPGSSSGLQSGNNSAQPTVPALTGNNIETVREAAINKVRPSVVQVNVDLGQGSAIGSGVIIDKRGYIVTNNHVVQGAQSIQVVLANGATEKAQLTGTDATDDLAVIKITPPANMAVATLGDSSKLKVGQEVIAVGNPLGITQTVTHGIVSALSRSVDEPGSSTSAGTTLPDAIQTDAPINPGNSGGALVDLSGNLIGIPTLVAVNSESNTPANGVGFAIPSNRVNFIVPQLIDNGRVIHTGRAGLGVRVTSVDPNLAAQYNLSVDHGVLITSVVKGGAADSAGLQAGDVIVQVDGQDVNGSLGDLLATKNPGDKITLKIYRQAQQLTVNVTLGELQAR